MVALVMPKRLISADAADGTMERNVVHHRKGGHFLLQTNFQNAFATLPGELVGSQLVGLFPV